MPRATRVPSTPDTRVPRLADLTRDAELRRVFLLAERDGGAAAFVSCDSPRGLTGGAVRRLEGVA